MKYYILERHNPQLGVYYVPEGKLTKKQAKRREGSIYGSNVMLEFENEQAYNDAIERLKKEGERI